MGELSVFIDESGDFGETRDEKDYYLVTFVFHDQSKDISNDIARFRECIDYLDFNIEYIHAGPIIRKEGIFEGYSLDERRKILYKIQNFAIKCPINQYTVAIRRKDAQDRVQLSGKIGKEIKLMLDRYHEYMESFDKIIVYYDNGQRELGAILNAIFSVSFSNVEFRKANPREYHLLQVADFFCTIELLRIKREEGRLSKGESKFFYKSNELKKTFIKTLEKKRM